MPTQYPPFPPAILFFLLIFAFSHAAANGLPDRISINCGSASPSSSFSRTEWMPDVYPKFSSSAVKIKGVSSRTSVTRDHLMVDPVPYGTARVSTSQFSYNFNLIPGQKYVRLHFNPTSYKFNSGIFRKKLDDYFSVEAGPFTLLSNFSASITARARGLNVIIKEFCVYVPDYQPFSVVFTPAVSLSSSQGFYAFINGIEIISVPSGLSYCHDGDVGVQILGQKSVVYIDNDSSTALEKVHRVNVKRDSGTSDAGDDNSMGAIVVGPRKNEGGFGTWKVAVDVGFRYLIRLHFCEICLKMAENGNKDFMVLIDGIIAATDAGEGKGSLWYKNYLLMVNGNKQEGLRDISISLHSKAEFLNGYGPLEGIEIFKLSNNDQSLASPNPLPPTGYSHCSTTQKFLITLGPANVITAVAIMVCCLVSLCKVQQSGECNLPEEEENIQSIKATGLCRRFSLSEMQSATDMFFEANVIGKGGFGKVYRGLIDNGNQTVAIKRLKGSSSQGKHEFHTEIKLLSELRHVNIVSLVGWCNEKQEMILVYEHVPGGSLADYLYKLAREDKTFHSLSWKQRLEICIGAGRGLDYLHTGHGIIHRDIKASNILLDDKFVAKISDFGLAKIYTGQSQASSNVKGTFGYMDPAYFRTHTLTMKSDTYAFGVMLLEVLCGRPAVEHWAEDGNRSLTEWALDKLRKGEVDQIVAPSLRDEISPASLNAFMKIVERCLDNEPKNRPAIAHVIINLEFALEQQQKANSSVPNEIVGAADALLITDDAVQLTNALSQNEIEHVPVLPQQVNEIKHEPVVRGREQEHVHVLPKFGDWSIVEQQCSLTEPLMVRGREKEVAMPSKGKNVTSSSKNVTKTNSTEQEHVRVVPKFGEWSEVEQQCSLTEPLMDRRREKEVLTSSKEKNVTSSLKNLAKTTMRKLSRPWPLDARKNEKSSKRKESINLVSAPVSGGIANTKLSDVTKFGDWSEVDQECYLTGPLTVRRREREVLSSSKGKNVTSSLKNVAKTNSIEQEHVRAVPKFGDWSEVDQQCSLTEPLMVRRREKEVLTSSKGKNVTSSLKNVAKTNSREQEHVSVVPKFGDWSEVDQQCSLTGPLTDRRREKEVMTSSKEKNVTSLKNVAKTTMRKLSRLWPLDASKNGKSSKRKESIRLISAPVSHGTANTKPSDGTLSQDKIDGEFVLTPHLRVFSYPELRTITQSFHADSFIGAGGFGRVFKGFLKENGIKTAVAVKQRISESAQGIQEWLSEIKFLGKLSHPNLVKLLGYCCEDKQLFLIYEYMEKGSLEDHLFRRGSLPLPWDIRLKIFIGAAHGLAYLHSAEKKVIYRDFKSSNILLGESYNSKLSDFGLAKAGPGDESTHVTTQPMGTYGYAAPEYILTGHLYVKSDVYGFGVVLLEMLTGRRVLDNSRPAEERNLVEWIEPHLSKREKLRRVMDPRLQGKFSINSAFHVAQLARNCLEQDPSKRPSSQEIVNKLEKLQSI